MGIENKQEQMENRLVRALLDGDDEVFTRAKAAMYLRTNYPEVFPIHDEENGRWILSAEEDRLDGTIFIGNMVEITTGNNPCPECGDTRRYESWFDNGIIGGERITCTVCDHVHFEDAG